MIKARFGHVNLIARDWRGLARFYTDLFGCVPVPPERDYSGPDLERGTGVPGAALRGAHLRLPGLGPDGPTLEIYQFSSMPDGLPPAVNRPGLGHIAFAVPSVVDERAAVLLLWRQRMSVEDRNSARARRAGLHLWCPQQQSPRGPACLGVAGAGAGVAA